MLCHTGPGALGGGSWHPTSCPACCSSWEDSPEHRASPTQRGGRPLWPGAEVLPCASFVPGLRAHPGYEELTAWERSGSLGSWGKMSPSTAGRRDSRGLGSSHTGSRWTEGQNTSRPGAAGIPTVAWPPAASRELFPALLPRVLGPGPALPISQMGKVGSKGLPVWN